MYTRQKASFSPLLMVAVVALLLVPASGCLGIFSNVMHAVGADLVPPEYDELEKSKVAIVTITDSSQYSQDPSARILSQKLGEILTREIKDFSLVRHDLVAKWRDTNGYESNEFVKLGKDLKADKVIVVKLSGMSLRDGPTLYRGSADATISVYAVKDDTIPYTRSLDEYTFPKTAGQYTSETTENRFRKLYLSMMAQQVGRLFHPYDLTATIAEDSRIASF